MEKWIVIVLLSYSALGSSFLLNSNSSLSAHTAHNVDQLFDLLLEEAHLRSQLESHVGVLEKKLLSLEAELKQKKIETDAALAQQSNTSKTQMETFNQAFSKAQINRHQLQQGYTRLTMGFQNLSVAHETNSAKLQNLSADLTALTKQDVSEQTLLNLEAELKEKDQNLSVDLNALTKQNEYLEQRLQHLTHETKALNQSILLSVSTNTADIATYHADLLKLRQKQGYQVGFTADDPTKGTLAGTIILSNVATNIGNQYNSATGKFTCVYPGVYYFTLSIYQSQSSHSAVCWIRENGFAVIGSFADTTASSSDGFYHGSTSVVLRLRKSDTIDLGNCTDVSTMAGATSLSGFLISSD